VFEMAAKNLSTVGATPGAALKPYDVEIPAELLEHVDRDSGKGVSFALEDQLTPLVCILQAGSPQVDKRGVEYIDTAEPGDFWFRTSVFPICPGQTGFTAIICGMQRVQMEYQPNRGGFAGRHFPMLPESAIEYRLVDTDGKPKRVAIRRDTGNTLVDTRELYLLVDNKPYVFGCHGTLHTFVKRLETYFIQLVHPRTGKVLPAFHRKYQITSQPAQNTLGNWFTAVFTDLRTAVTSQEYERARRFNQDIEAGRVRGEAPPSSSV
jgi:hypothetical protein